MITEATDTMCDHLNVGLLKLASDNNKVAESTATSSSPKTIRSGSHTDIGSRTLNEDQHIMIDDLSNHLGDAYKWGRLATSFYALFDGHGGPEAASYVKDYTMRLFFDNSDLPQAAVEEFHHKAFLQADQALVDECSVSDYCGTTALTVLIMGKDVIIANAGDCRAVLCRNGSAIQMTQDHRGSTCLQEKERCERLGGYFDGEGYLNGQLGVTRALGDRYMKKDNNNDKMLIAEPDVRQMVLNDNDEFMIIACDGVWDVMSNQEAVALVRCQLRQHNDPQRCAKELVNQALRLNSTDNLTAIVVCFTSHKPAAQTRFPNSRLFKKKPLNIV